jgi:hypothetical protein
MAKKATKNTNDSTKQQSSAVQDIDDGLASISGRHKLIKQQIDAQTASLETQKVAYDSIAKAQQKGADVDKEAEQVKKRLKKEQDSLNKAAKETKEAFDGIGESLDEIGSSGVSGMRELVTVLKEAKTGGKALSVALFALGAAAGGIAYNLGLVGDKLGTIAKYDKQIAPLQEKMDLLRNSIEGAFAGQEAAGRFGFEMQRMAVSFEKASKTALFGKGLGSVGYGAGQLQLAGVGAEQIASQMQAASDATGKMPSSKVAADMAVLAARTGQSAEGIASINEMFTRVDGSAESTALNMQEGLRAMADQAGINLGGLMTEMAESSKEMLGYQIKSGSALARQVTFARTMGVSFQDIAKAGQSMVLNYKDSIKSEMQLSAMLGKNVDLSEVRASFASGDTEGALKALQAQGLDPAKMDMFQQQMLQQATGMDLTTLSKINKNTGKSVELGEGNAKAGNKSFLGATESAARTEAVQNANISVQEAAFNISMEAKKKMAVLESEQMRAYQNQINQLEALKDAETGLTTALISLLSGLVTSGIGSLFQKGGMKNAKDMLMGPKPGAGGNALWNETKYAKNAAGRYVDPTTKRFVSNKAVADAKSAGQMGGMTKMAKVGGSALAGAFGAVEGYSNFNKVREGETETRTTDKAGAGLVQGGLAAAGTAIGAAFGGPIGMMVGGFIGNTLGGALNEHAPGLAQGIGDVFGGMSRAWDTLKAKLTGVWDSLQPLRDAFASLASALGFEEGGMSGVLGMIGELIGNVLIAPFMILADVFTFVGNLIGGFVQIFTGDFAGGFETIGNAIGGFFSGIWDTIKGTFAGLWNWIAGSKIGKLFGMEMMEVPAASKKTETKSTAAPAKTGTATATTTTGVDTKVAAKAATTPTTAGGGGGGMTTVTDTGSKSIIDAMMKSSSWMQDKMTYMSGNLERVVARTEQTANNTAASLEQIKVLNTNTLAMKELTRKIEALTRAQYEGGTTVRIDGKVLANAATKYQDNTTGMVGTTSTKTTYG